mmetsp:Transcript_22393/g.19296  ORF Transcript_22393/g.19296 Transcript_22393/m.19296 type:complete len:132 (-) Transcript_22393:754-1149(-)
MKNKYGNYVILKLLQVAEVEEKQQIMQALIKNVNSMNVPKYKSKWIQFIEDNPLKVPNVNFSQNPKPSIFKSQSGDDQGGRGSPRSQRYNNEDGSKSSTNQQNNKVDPNKDSGFSQFYYQNTGGPMNPGPN